MRRQVPEAASYYSLEASTIMWKFPEPGFLEGVKTKDKAILKMGSMAFGYPGAEKNILNDVNVQARCPFWLLLLLLLPLPRRHCYEQRAGADVVQCSPCWIIKLAELLCLHVLQVREQQLNLLCACLCSSLDCLHVMVILLCCS